MPCLHKCFNVGCNHYVTTRKVTRQFQKPNLNDNYYHESGHVIFAKLFPETFKVEKVTLDLSTAKQLDILSLGGLKGKFAIPVSNLSIYDHDKAVLAMLAGMCVDDINNNNGKINSSFYQIPTWATKFNQLRYQGDVELIIRHFDQMKIMMNITWQEYISNTLKFTHDILLDNNIWKSVNKLRKELIKAQNQTLYDKEIDLILKSCNFQKWVDLNKQTILNQREDFLDN